MNLKRLLSLLMLVVFASTNVITTKVYAASTPLLGLPEPGSMVDLSAAFKPVMVKGLTVHPENPLMFDFIVSGGDTGLKGMDLKDESQKLIKYFLACLTVPENNWWVNLSPYENDKIVADDLGQTDLGRDMLAQDYLLKQVTASLIYPEKKVGKNFWDRVYSKAQAQFGSTQVPVNTFNKVWVLADKAEVLERNNTAFVVGSHLKVMLDSDYLAMNKNTKADAVLPAQDVASQMMRQIVIPELEREVNTGKNFAQLRQIYNALILANWYKIRLKDALLNQVYVNQGKVAGIDLTDKDIKEKIYQRYLAAYKKGAFNYIKEEVGANQKSLPRKYFSGGALPGNAAANRLAVRQQATPSDEALIAAEAASMYRVPFVLDRSGDNSMTATAENQIDFNTALKEVVTASGRNEDNLRNTYAIVSKNLGEVSFENWIVKLALETRAQLAKERIKIAAPRSDASMVSEFHEKLIRKLADFAERNDGSLPQAMHPVIAKVRVRDIVNAGGDVKNMIPSEKLANQQIADAELIRLSQTGEKIAAGAMVAGMASRNQKGKLPDLYIRAMKDDPDQFVDKTKLGKYSDRIAQAGGLKAFIQLLDPSKDAEHDILNELLHESKALLPINEKPIDGKWYNFLAYTAINVKRANEALERKGLNRVFVYKIMASEMNYQKIVDNLIQNNFFGLNVPGVIRDAAGSIVDIDHTDVRNEVVVYVQGAGYRMVAPIASVEAQWKIDSELLKQASLEKDASKSAGLVAKTQFASEAEYKEALAFAKANQGKVLYDAPVAEGHGERWHSQFEVNKFGPQVPNFLLDVKRKIKYEFFHNIDNMASIDDNWRVIFGWMLKNKKKVVMEASMKPSNESAGGGFTWTNVKDASGKLVKVMRQVEGPELKASLNSTTSPEYNGTEEAQKEAETVGDVKNEMPINNATVTAVLPTSAEDILNGVDAISSNLTKEQREGLAAKVRTALETGDLNVDLKSYADALRSNFGALSTVKSVKYNGSKILSVINETLAWDIQMGLLAQNAVGFVFTGSLADVRERGFNAEQARFIPLKQRDDARDPVITEAREKVSKRILFGDFFSLSIPPRGPSAVSAVKPDAVPPRLSDLPGADKAMLNPGGIDFNPKNLGMTVTKEGDGVKITINPAEVERMKREGVRGFTPIIINIVPIANVMPLLGLEAPSRRDTEQLAGV